MSSRAQAIHRVPTEVLSEIFTHLRPRLDSSRVFDPYYLEDPTRAQNWRYMLSVASVCRAWRAAALTSPDLWTYVEPRDIGTNALKLFLGRSGVMPLEVDIDMQGITQEALATLDTASHHIKQLLICLGEYEEEACSHEVLNTLRATLRGDAPLLETLVVYFGDSNEGCAPEPYQLPPIFNGHLPCIRTIDLTEISAWPAGMFSNLEELTISYTCEDIPEGTIDPILDLLRASPGIRTIHLQCALNLNTTSSANSPAWNELIHLDYLDRIHIDDSCTLISGFFRHISLPVTALLVIETNFINWGLNNGQTPLLNIFPDDHSHLGPFTAVTQLHMKRIGDSMKFEGFDSGGREAVKISLYGLPQSQEFPYRFPMETLLRSIRPFIPTQITILLVNPVEDYYAPGTSCRTWKTFFASLPNLTALYLDGNPTAAVFNALNVHAAGDMPCPKLHTLRVFCKAFPTDVQDPFYELIRSRCERLGGGGESTRVLQNIRIVYCTHTTDSESRPSPYFESLKSIGRRVSEQVPKFEIVTGKEDDGEDEGEPWWSDDYGLNRTSNP